MPKDSNYENIHNNFLLLPTRFICKRMFFLEEKLYKSVKKNNKDDARQNYLAEFACSLRRNVNANMHNKLRPWKYLAWAGKETFCDRQNFAEGKQISPSFWNTVAKVFFIFWGEIWIHILKNGCVLPIHSHAPPSSILILIRFCICVLYFLQNKKCPKVLKIQPSV